MNKATVGSCSMRSIVSVSLDVLECAGWPASALRTLIQFFFLLRLSRATHCCETNQGHWRKKGDIEASKEKDVHGRKPTAV